ncbi:MAG: hypothetical protein R3C53_16065 [Pirellulaceae bacterium]
MTHIPPRRPTVPNKFAAQTIYAGMPRQDTLYGGMPRQMDTLYGGMPRQMDTLYGGMPRQMDTLYGGMRRQMDTLYGGSKHLSGSSPISVRVIDPQTRKAMTVMYNPVTKLYLNNQTRSWMPAPNWMRSQIR